TTLAGYGITDASVANLTDTTITAPAAGHLLRWNGSKWVNVTLVASDIPALDWSKIGSGKPTTLAGYGITDAVALAAFTAANQSLAASGYQKLPGGLIIQWGRAVFTDTSTSVGAVTSNVITLPVTFPTRCLWAAAGAGDDDGTVGNESIEHIFSMAATTASQLTLKALRIYGNSGGGDERYSVYWLAIGY
ncbi:gp53-like domain-containing protein, partial [Crenobacter luteus]|uniref:gp53-like domain-containing protein n=1 Tax=Crenobacter luteus TaxID=1452487 RepID=UPI001A9E525D